MTVVITIATCQSNSDLFDAADAAIANHLAGGAEVDVATLLAAGLPDDSSLFDHVAHETALTDGQGERFFTVDVLASAGGGHSLESVPVIWRRDLHCIDFRAGEEIAEVLMHRAAVPCVVAVDQSAHGFATESSGFFGDVFVVAGGLAFDVADCDDLDALIVEEVFDHIGAATAAADEA